MKLIIDIPNEAYDILTEYQVLPDNIDLEYFVIHGIPLEEELEKIKAELENPKVIGMDFFDGLYYAEEIIDKHISELKGENNNE